MRYWILCITMICSLSACRLSFGSAANETPTNQPAITQVAATATKTTPQSATATPRPSNTPPKINTSVPTLQPNCVKQTSWPTYSIVSGDTLGKIAQRTSSDVATLVSANCLSDANQINVGQVIYVPRAPVTIPPTAAPSGDGFVLSSLPANAGCYFQIYGMIGTTDVYTSPTTPAGNAIATISMGFFYRIYSQTTTHYELAYNAQGNTGWVEKFGGDPVGDCRVLTQAPAKTVTTYYSGIAFDHPSNWYSGVNIDGLPGGYLGSIRGSERPADNATWGNDKVIIGYVVMPDGIVPTDLEAAARQELEGWRTQAGYTIIQELTGFTTTSGINGFVFDYAGPGSGSRVYYFHVNGKTVTFNVHGNRMLGETVINTMRGA